MRKSAVTKILPTIWPLVPSTVGFYRSMMTLHQE
jgi:uncharacterized membrane protein YjjB (DUF3815 family)